MTNVNDYYLNINYKIEYSSLIKKIDKVSFFIIDGITGNIIVDEVCKMGRCSGTIIFNKINKCNWYIDDNNKVLIDSDNNFLYKLKDVLMEIYELKLNITDLFERMLYEQ